MALPNSKKRKIFDGRYEVIEIVGRGSDSVVYHAKHIGSSTQEVALKVLVNHKGKNSLTGRLRKEALTLVSCRHKYVVRLDDFHSVDDLCYLSMEYAAKGDLRKYVEAAGGRISPEKASLFLHQVLEALDFVHMTGVVHRDMKPENILVASDKEIRLADFGLALLPGDDVSLDDLKSGVGSFGYLPPESLEGIRYDTRSDLYALGLCFYELLSGTHPFESLHLAEQLERRRDGAISALHEIDPSVPRHLSAVISTLMKFEPASRFQTALDAIKALGNPDFDKEVIEQKMVANAAPLVVETPTQKRLEPTSPSAGVAANADTPIAVSSHTNSFYLDNDTESDFDLFDEEPVDSPPFSYHSASSESPEPHEVENKVFGPPSDAEPQAAAHQGERIPQPTERIDLERIKEIIDKDAQKKAEIAARKQHADQERAVSQSVNDVRESRKKQGERPEKYSLEEKRASRSDQHNTFVARFRSIPPTFRPAVVGLAAALLTIASVALFQLLPFGGGSSSPADDTYSTQQTDPSDSSRDASQEEAKAADAFVFPHIPEGTYVGQIDDLIPGVRAPITLISKPQNRQLVVIVGIAGWSPALVSTNPEPNAPSSTLAIRSNGMILYVTGELSSDTISGTFNNAVTGESGIWRVSKLS
jgi:serine/threonine protein kinase